MLLREAVLLIQHGLSYNGRMVFLEATTQKEKDASKNDKAKEETEEKTEEYKREEENTERKTDENKAAEEVSAE